MELKEHRAGRVMLELLDFKDHKDGWDHKATHHRVHKASVVIKVIMALKDSKVFVVHKEIKVIRASRALASKGLLVHRAIKGIKAGKVRKD